MRRQARGGIAMNAEETLAYLREQGTFDVKTEAGRLYTIRLPDIMRLMAYGNIPVGSLREAVTAGNDVAELDLTPEQQTEAVRAMYALNDQMLQEAIEAIDGTSVTMSPDSVKLIPPDDRAELLEYLRREKTDPNAD